MRPDRLIVCTYRGSDGLSMRPDDHNTLPCQSYNTNDSPREPLHGPVTWNPDRTRPYSTLHYVNIYAYSHGISTAVTITSSNALMYQEPAHCCI